MAITFILLLFGFITVIVFRRYLQSAVKHNAERHAAMTTTGDQCRCGYPLVDLDLARCPECGRVIHFDATAEELGLTKEELELAQRKRMERAAKQKN